MPKRLPPGVTPRAEVSPSQRGFPTIRISDAVKARFDAYRCATEDRPKGDLSQTDALSRLLDLAASADRMVPLDVLEPVTVALHDLERQVQGGRFHSPEELVSAVRAIRKQIEALP